jgi:uncharacterized protein (DUF488 family)
MTLGILTRPRVLRHPSSAGSRFILDARLSMMSNVQIFTIGHSNRSLEEFLALLRAYGIRCLVDVRRFPHSRRNPQFNCHPLPLLRPPRGFFSAPPAAGGGGPPPRPDSPNTGWVNAGFRGFADYMQTPVFTAALEELLQVARHEGPLALLCAEAVPWRCHRSLIADALAARGISVWHILSPTRLQPHQLTVFAQVRQGVVQYPGRS